MIVHYINKAGSGSMALHRGRGAGPRRTARWVWLFAGYLTATGARAELPPPTTGATSAPEGTTAARATPPAPTKQSEQASTAATEPESILVTGTRPHPLRPAREPSTAGSSLARERLAQPGVDLAEGLREAPGVQVTRAGGLGSPATARLRGATAAQTPVYLGSLRLNDEVGGVADLSSVPSHFIERVEIYRSHTPRLLSEQGIGGAIVLVPRQPRQPEFAVIGELGSYGTRALRGRLSLGEGPRQWLLAAEVEAADNDYPFEDSRGTLLDGSNTTRTRLPNADAEDTNFWLLGRERIGPARLALLVHHAHREQGAPKLALVPSESARSSLRRDLVALDAEVPMARGAGSFRSSTRFLSGSTTLDDPMLELGTLSPRIVTPGERAEQEFESSFDLGQRLSTSALLTVASERHRRFERRQAADELALAAQRLSTRLALAAGYQPLAPLHLDALIAGRCFDTSQTTLRACPERSGSGRGSIRWEARTWEVYANAGRYLRLPTLSELHGAGLVVRGNPDLEPELGSTFGSGLRLQVPRPGQSPLVWLDAAGFVRRSTKLVSYLRTAQGYLRPVNRDSARTLGGEFALGSQPFAGLHLEAQLSLLDPRDTSSSRTTENDILPFLSRAMAFVRAEYVWQVGSPRTFESLSLGSRTYYQSSRYADPAGLGVIPSQSFTDLELVARGFNAFVLRGRLSNLFDAERFDVVGFPLPGRSGFVSLEVNL